MSLVLRGGVWVFQAVGRRAPKPASQMLLGFKWMPLMCLSSASLFTFFQWNCWSEPRNQKMMLLQSHQRHLRRNNEKWLSDCLVVEAKNRFDFATEAPDNDDADTEAPTEESDYDPFAGQVGRLQPLLTQTCQSWNLSNFLCDTSRASGWTAAIWKLARREHLWFIHKIYMSFGRARNTTLSPKLSRQWRRPTCR